MYLQPASARARNLEIERIGEIEGELAFTAVVLIGSGIHDRQGAGYRDLDGLAAEFLRAAEIVVEKVIAMRFDGRVDGWQVGDRGAIAMHTVGQVDEIDAVEMAAVIMNVIFATLLAIAGNIDTAIELIAYRFSGCPQQQLFWHLIGIVLGITESASCTVIGAPVSAKLPIST